MVLHHVFYTANQYNLPASDSTDEDHALIYLEKILQMDTLSSENSNNLKLYHTIARVTVPKTVSIGDESKDICLNIELEDSNFKKVDPGTAFASVNSTKEQLIIVNSESHEDITDEYMEIKDNGIKFKKPITLSMFTTSERAIRQDCVCYLMEELHVG